MEGEVEGLLYNVASMMEEGGDFAVLPVMDRLGVDSLPREWRGVGRAIRAQLLFSEGLAAEALKEAVRAFGEWVSAPAEVKRLRWAHAEVLIALAKASVSYGRYDLALSFARRSIRLRDTVRARLIASTCLSAMGRGAEALAEAEAAFEKLPSMDTCRAVAWSLVAAGKPREALRFLRSEDFGLGARIDILRILLLLHNRRELEEELAEFVDHEEDSSGEYISKAVFLIGFGYPNLALHAAKRGEEEAANPVEFFIARAVRADALIALGREAEAASLLAEGEPPEGVEKANLSAIISKPTMSLLDRLWGGRFTGKNMGTTHSQA